MKRIFKVILHNTLPRLKRARNRKNSRTRHNNDKISLIEQNKTFYLTLLRLIHSKNKQVDSILVPDNLLKLFQGFGNLYLKLNGIETF